MQLKDTVKLQGVSPELTIAMMVVDTAYIRYGYNLTITSVCDSKHSFKSLHYTGNAFDCRIWEIPGNMLSQVVGRIRNTLTPDFDVVLAMGRDGKPSHIHVEYQPKTPTHLLDI